MNTDRAVLLLQRDSKDVGEWYRTVRAQLRLLHLCGRRRELLEQRSFGLVHRNLLAHSFFHQEATYSSTANRFRREHHERNGATVHALTVLLHSAKLSARIRPLEHLPSESTSTTGATYSFEGSLLARGRHFDSPERLTRPREQVPQMTPRPPERRTRPRDQERNS